MKFATLFVALALCFAVASAQSSWSQTCTGSGTATLTVSSVTLNPDPPVLGQNDTVTLTGTLGEQITQGASIALQITYFGIPVFNGNYDVCAENACPLGPGDVTASIVVLGDSLPPIAPPGQYIATATFNDQAGATIACVAVTFNL
jgi:hypothetical protein